MAAITSSGTFTDPTSALAVMRTFLTSNGWTENLYEAEGASGGYRLHVEKTVDSQVYYFNLRSVYNEVLTDGGGDVYGIMTYISTGFNEFSSFINQPGGPTTNNKRCAGGVTLNQGGGSYAYYFVHDTDHTSFFLEDFDGNKRPIIFSVGSLGSSYHSSYSFTYYFGDNSSPNTFMRLREGSQDELCSSSGLLLKGGSHVFINRNYYGSDYGDGDMAYFFYARNGVQDRSVVYDLWVNSPNPNSGIPVLVPFVLTIPEDSTKDLVGSDPRVLVDDLKNIKVVNAKYLETEQDIVVGGDTYRIYKTGTSTSEAIAVKIS